MAIMRMLEGRDFEPKAAAILVEALTRSLRSLICEPSQIGSGPRGSLSSLRRPKRTWTLRNCGTMPSA